MSVTPIVLILMTTGLFFVTVGGRMVPAMTMISAAALPEYRGSFMSVVSCIQQLAAAMAATLAGFIISRNEAGQLLNYPWVGLVALVFSVLSLLAARKLVFVEVKNG